GTTPPRGASCSRPAPTSTGCAGSRRARRRRPDSGDPPLPTGTRERYARNVPCAPLRSWAMKHARNDGPDLAFRLGRRVVAAVVDDMSTLQRVGVGVAGALVALTPFGACSEDQAHADPLTTGTAVDVGPFEMTVEKAAVADELGWLVPEPGNHMLAVVVNVTNTGDVPEYSATLGSTIPAPRGVGIVPEEPLGGLGEDLLAEPDASIGEATEAGPADDTTD